MQFIVILLKKYNIEVQSNSRVSVGVLKVLKGKKINFGKMKAI